MNNLWRKLLEKIGMLLVFPPNSFFICFVKLATEHTFSPLFDVHTHTHTHTHTKTHFFFFRRIYGHLQTGSWFCKQNLLRLQPSANSPHQQPCLSEHPIHTHTHKHTHGSVPNAARTAGEEEKAIIHPACSGKIPSRSSRMLFWLAEARWLCNFCAFPFPRAEVSFVCD